MFFKIGFLKNLLNFTGKHLCWILFLIKLFLRTPFSTEYLRWLLLFVMKFGADMSSSVHIDNKKKYILILGKGPTNGLDDIILTAEKEYSINFTEQQKNLV